MSEGTTLDAIESGDIQNEADLSRMEAIRQDMNALGAEVVEMAPPPAPMQQHAAPTYAQPPRARPQPQYIPMDEEDEYEHAAPAPRHAAPKKRRNLWSDVMESIQEPLIVAVLLFALNLPVLHTFMAKYAAWAFAVGGQLSWLGLIVLSLMGGTVFGLYKSLISN